MMPTITDEIDRANGIDVRCFMLRDRNLDKMLTPAEAAYWKSLGQYHARLAVSFISLALATRTESVPSAMLADTLEEILRSKTAVGINYANLAREAVGFEPMPIGPNSI